MKSILVCFGLCIGAAAAFSQDLQARFVEVSGRVEIREAGSSGWKTAAPGLSVGGNTVIATGFRSSAVISLGSSRLGVRPLTMLTLEELTQRGGTEETSLYLRTGRVRATVDRPAGLAVDFKVRSPTVTASVRGTSFEFDGINLRVENGLVLLASPKGQKVYAAEGQRSRVDKSNQNRIVPPFELETALLQPLIPEPADAVIGAALPGISPDPGSDPGTRIYIGWP
ncbi:MAG: FecR family protein [Treponema sp.]|jgi:hypothetical protein|nr:FecR family protein [Treponema sp.]